MLRLLALPSVFCLLTASGPAPARAASQSGAERGALALFVQPDVSEVGRTFEKDRLPPIRQLAAELGIEVRVLDPRDGAPEEVGITPLLVYQNWRGRSIYQGRVANLGAIRTFLRTSRWVPQGDAALTRTDTPVWDRGRAKIALPLKIVDLAGATPTGFDADAFRAEAAGAIASGLQHFPVPDSVSLGRSDRLFYLDFYPWRSEADELLVSLAVFSQFHCERPVFETKEPVTGSWTERGEVFARAAAHLEDVVVRHLAETELGDGFDPVRAGAPIASWEELDLALPARPRGATPTTDAPLPAAWTVTAPDPDDPPPVQFRFPAPLDRYTGLAESVRGELTLGRDRGAGGSRGWFEVDTRSLTMGQDELDKVIHGGPFLDCDDHPVSRFELESVDAEPGELGFGRGIPGQATGTFQLRGVALPLSSRVRLEPIANAAGAPRLLLTGSFELRLKGPFGMLGADGPWPESDTVIVDVRLVLEPAET